MTISLLPKILADSITDLTVQQLHDWGIQLLMLDFDNTIVPYTTNVPTKEVEQWLERMKQSDIQLCVVSNSKKERVKIFCKKYGIDCITHAKKPFSKGICTCLQKYQLQPRFCALVGDQIFTDTLGANGCGVRSILVKAIDNHNFWLKARHLLEIPFILLASGRKIRQ
mgnify:CR=1 FL=1